MCQSFNHFQGFLKEKLFCIGQISHQQHKGYMFSHISVGGGEVGWWRLQGGGGGYLLSITLSSLVSRPTAAENVSIKPLRN